MKSAGNLSEKNQRCVTAAVMLKVEELIRNNIILQKGEMKSARKKAISKDDKNLIAKLDKQIRSYVQEYGTSRDSELLDQAIADIIKHHQNQTRKSNAVNNKGTKCQQTNDLFGNL